MVTIILAIQRTAVPCVWYRCDHTEWGECRKIHFIWENVGKSCTLPPEVEEYRTGCPIQVWSCRVPVWQNARQESPRNRHSRSRLQTSSDINFRQAPLVRAYAMPHLIVFFWNYNKSARYSQLGLMGTFHYSLRDKSRFACDAIQLSLMKKKGIHIHDQPFSLSIDILRNFICHLDRHFLKFLAISVRNQQTTETTNPLQIEKV